MKFIDLIAAINDVQYTEVKHILELKPSLDDIVSPDDLQEVFAMVAPSIVIAAVMRTVMRDKSPEMANNRNLYILSCLAKLPDCEYRSGVFFPHQEHVADIIECALASSNDAGILAMARMLSVTYVHVEMDLFMELAKRIHSVKDNGVMAKLFAWRAKSATDDDLLVLMDMAIDKYTNLLGRSNWVEFSQIMAMRHPFHPHFTGILKTPSLQIDVGLLPFTMVTSPEEVTNMMVAAKNGNYDQFHDFCWNLEKHGVTMDTAALYKKI